MEAYLLFPSRPSTHSADIAHSHGKSYRGHLPYIPIRMMMSGLFVAFASMCCNVNAQPVAIKTNLVSDAITSPSLGIEIGTGNKNTLQLFYSLNPWTFSSDSHGDRKARYWNVMPEFRWWTCSKFNGHFFGVHLMGGEYNASNVALPIPGAFFKGDNLTKEVKDHRYQGGYAGGGFTYGYQWILSRHWNFEAEIGVGYNYVWYDKYPCYECGSKIASGHTNYVGVTKVGLSLLYIF